MFLIHMPLTFKVGDTADVRINGQPRKLAWETEMTLVIDGDDRRTILDWHRSGDLQCFVCSDRGRPDQDVVVNVMVPHD